MIRTLRFALTFAAAVLVTGAAYADPPKGDPPGKEIKEAREKVREDKKELHEARKAGDAGAAEKAREDLKADRKELTEEQKERRKAHMAEMRAKWGAIQKMPGVREEMRMHASRMARLRRIDKIALEKKKDAVAKRAEAAMEKEKARHEKRMTELKAKGADAGAATGGAK